MYVYIYMSPAPARWYGHTPLPTPQNLAFVSAFGRHSLPFVRFFAALKSHNFVIPITCLYTAYRLIAYLTQNLLLSVCLYTSCLPPIRYSKRTYAYLHAMYLDAAYTFKPIYLKKIKINTPTNIIYLCIAYTVPHHYLYTPYTCIRPSRPN